MSRGAGAHRAAPAPGAPGGRAKAAPGPPRGGRMGYQAGRGRKPRRDDPWDDGAQL